VGSVGGVGGKNIDIRRIPNFQLPNSNLVLEPRELLE
jgi:hypothetical protein